MEPAWLRDRLYSWGHMTTTFQIIIFSKHSPVPAAAAPEKPARQTCFKPLKPEHADHETHANSQSTAPAALHLPPHTEDERPIIVIFRCISAGRSCSCILGRSRTASRCEAQTSWRSGRPNHTETEKSSSDGATAQARTLNTAVCLPLLMTPQSEGGLSRSFTGFPLWMSLPPNWTGALISLSWRCARLCCPCPRYLLITSRPLLL